jgi:2-iminobutanoate/2-iminopropanoate deaminase
MEYGFHAMMVLCNRRRSMAKEVIRVEPLTTYLERVKAPASVATRHNDTIYVSGLPPFDPQTGEIAKVPIERQTELVLEQLKLCVETAGSSLENVLKCNVYCTSAEKFAAVNAIYARYFPKKSSGAHFCLRAPMVRAFRHRDRLHRRGVARRSVATTELVATTAVVSLSRVRER